MSSQHVTTIRSIVDIDLLDELRSFIKVSSSKHKTPTVESTKSALFLLRHLPASRFACLQYMKTVFDAAALNHIIRLEKEINTGKLPPVNEYDETMLHEIHAVLCSFISNHTEAWAPVLSAFSLELLGEISSSYARRAQLNGLNDSLQFWTNCRATKALVDITTQCLTCLMCSNTEACINALLDTSIVHSPHFDWVVAHVGSCFPETVIERVLYCGLKDYCGNKTYKHGADSPKVKSVVGILGYLTISHSPIVQKAMFDLFRLCFNETPDEDFQEMHKNATIPYLIQLLILSDGLIDVVSDKIKQNVTIETISTLFALQITWFKYFGPPEAIMDMVVALIMKSSKGGAEVLELLLDCIESKQREVREWSLDLLAHILDEIGYNVRFYNSNRSGKPLHFLDSLYVHIDLVYKLLLSDNNVSAQTAARIIIFIGTTKLPALIQSLIFLLQNATNDKQLAYFVMILTDELTDKNQNHFASTLRHIFDKDFVKMKGCHSAVDFQKFEQMWMNIRTLLKWEKSNNVLKLQSKCVSIGIITNLTDLTGIFKSNVLNSMCSHILCEILDILDIPSANGIRLPLQVLLNYVHGSINYFFLCCKEQVEITRVCGFKRVHRIFIKLARHSKISRNLCFRQLLEKALFSQQAALFGAAPKNNFFTVDRNGGLLEENRKISKTIHLTKHSSVYNGGVIGNGKRKSIDSGSVTNNLNTNNTAQLIIAFKSCCVPSSEDADVKTTANAQLEGLTIISLMLVELISPDVMYNGLPWPEEEFSKVTIERDLLIRRLFNSTPLLWELLNLVASHRPALCYCSVLLRALTATLIHQWTSMGDHSKSTASDSYKNLMKVTVRVVDVMTLGQLLPPPLCHVRDVIPYLNSQEIVTILRECIWCYMRDYIPSPALFCVDANGLQWRDPKDIRPIDAYTKTLRTIMQRNIKIVGHLYPRIFSSCT